MASAASGRKGGGDGSGSSAVAGKKAAAAAAKKDEKLEVGSPSSSEHFYAGATIRAPSAAAVPLPSERMVRQWRELRGRLLRLPGSSPPSVPSPSSSLPHPTALPPAASSPKP
eukprot:RCo016828